MMKLIRLKIFYHYKTDIACSKFQQQATTATVVHMSKNFIILQLYWPVPCLRRSSWKFKNSDLFRDDGEEHDQVGSAVSDSDKAAQCFQQ
jgi:hypothetical protein